MEKKPSFAEIGEKIRRENQVALRKAQSDFDSIKRLSEGRSPMYRGRYAGQLQRARNHLNLILKDIEHEPILIEFRELKAEEKWYNTIIKELEAEGVVEQKKIDMYEHDFALLEKYGYINGYIKPKT